MTDVSHRWGGDLEVSPTGDIRVGTTDEVTNQRILRRLLTGPGQYIWQLPYGAGLGRLVGSPTDTRRIQAIVAVQLGLEAAVAADPRPSINVVPATVGTPGTMVVEIRYRNAQSGQEQTTTLPMRL